jgi:hypothetical protein
VWNIVDKKKEKKSIKKYVSKIDLESDDGERRDVGLLR